MYFKKQLVTNYDIKITHKMQVTQVQVSKSALKYKTNTATTQDNEERRIKKPSPYPLRKTNDGTPNSRQISKGPKEHEHRKLSRQNMEVSSNTVRFLEEQHIMMLQQASQLAPIRLRFFQVGGGRSEQSCTIPCTDSKGPAAKKGMQATRIDRKRGGRERVKQQRRGRDKRTRQVNTKVRTRRRRGSYQ
jgi:hypothetical protein